MPAFAGVTVEGLGISFVADRPRKRKLETDNHA
jgi:hypothetical protein